MYFIQKKKKAVTALIITNSWVGHILTSSFVHPFSCNLQQNKSFKEIEIGRNQLHPQHHQLWRSRIVPLIFCTLSSNKSHLIFYPHQVKLLLSSPWVEILFHAPAILHWTTKLNIDLVNATFDWFMIIKDFACLFLAKDDWVGKKNNISSCAKHLFASS